MTPIRSIHALFPLALILAGCAGADRAGSLAAAGAVESAQAARPAGTADAAGEVSRADPGTVDSIFPIEEEIRRFRAAIGEEASALDDGALSRDDLVLGFVRALEAGDTAAAVASALTPAEFIDLYFPHTVYTKPPYQMDPAVIWFQMQNHGSRGLSRALARFGGRAIEFAGYTCPEEPAIEGPNRTWDGCRVRIGGGAGEVELRLFGMILEREGRYKFVSLTNGL